jgi:quinol monooxygenase YgiN
MIFIVVKFPIRPDKLDEWETVREEHTRGARSEEGCLFFGYSRSVDDPNEYVCVEAFRDNDAAAHHVSTQAFKDFVERMPDIVSAHPQIINTVIEGQDGFGPMGEIAPRNA